MAFVTDMAGRHDLMNMVALNSLLVNVARLLGFLMTGYGVVLDTFRPDETAAK